MKTTLIRLIIIFFFFIRITNVLAQATSLPLIQIEDLEYQGAFIIPGGDNGESRADYAAGAIEYNPANHSIFFAGYSLHGAIAELAIPTLVNSTDVSALNSATFLQNFSKVLDRTPDSNPQNINRVTGIKLFNGKLIVNGLEYYDAPANNTHTTLVIDNASDIANSTVEGYYELQGAAHIAGWMSPVPTEWKGLLGGNYIAGNSSKLPINGRQSMGPSAFVFDPSILSGSPSGVISTTILLDFDLGNPLYADYSDYDNAHYNLIEVNGTTGPGHTFADADAVVGNNNLWTSSSQASYGFIVPGSRTYMTLGSSGGHASGIGYKATQNNGNLCGGPCPYDADDYYNYYWLWDVSDLVSVKNGTKQPYEVRPYSYGVFDVPFQTDIYTGGTPEHHPIIGGTYDLASGRLYLTVYDAGSTTAYARIPLVIAYTFSSLLSTDDEIFSNTISITPNPTYDTFTIDLGDDILKEAIIYNELGQQIKETTSNEVDISNLSIGIYFVKITSQSGKEATKKIIKL
ncbi:MAG: T9SS type A sorting domain-containing protein [Flavobacteriaceae bacterium]|nr:T9SS type A sorting domain-containing protein [Flavobacteriaceae bacterium]